MLPYRPEIGFHFALVSPLVPDPALLACHRQSFLADEGSHGLRFRVLCHSDRSVFLLTLKDGKGRVPLTHTDRGYNPSETP